MGGDNVIQKRTVCYLLLVILGIVLPAYTQVVQTSARITIDPGQRFQRIQGFGVNYTGP